MTTTTMSLKDVLLAMEGALNVHPLDSASEKLERLAGVLRQCAGRVGIPADKDQLRRLAADFDDVSMQVRSELEER